MRHVAKQTLEEDSSVTEDILSPRALTHKCVQSLTHIRNAIGLCIALVCGIAVVWCMRIRPTAVNRDFDADGNAGPAAGLVAEFSSTFVCSGDWPEPWFEDGWAVYCRKPKNKAWVMTEACNYAGWQWGWNSLQVSSDKAMAQCKQGGSDCFVFDRNGEKCSNAGGSKKPPSKKPPSLVQWGPPFEGFFLAGQSANECAPTHCAGGINEDAIDISMPKRTPIIAGRAGVVKRIADGHGDGGVCQNGRSYQANIVGILNDDGTEDQYLHLLKGTIKVKNGDRVKAGDLLAESGNSGCSSGPHLHIHTLKPTFDGTVDMAFTFPCHDVSKAEVKRGTNLCNMKNCVCESTFCEKSIWGQGKLAHWKDYCQFTGKKAWASDEVCQKYYFWKGGSDPAAKAMENCGKTGLTCKLRDENGNSCSDCADITISGQPWHDSDGPHYHCSWYAANAAHCAQHGNKYANSGYTANKACCTCGGGKSSNVQVQ